MIYLSVQERDFDVGREYQELVQASAHAGAIVFFVGLVRDFYPQLSPAKDNAEKIDYIELTHYPGMTESLCEIIMHKAQQRFGISAARVIHRVGRLKAGEQIVFVAVSGEHRKAAFDAAQFIMDYLKTQATLWKREVGSRGAKWVAMKESDNEATERWEN